ncbi:hypothetical protein B0H17DRAFT_1206023 [Mycena rosella]|uniref:Uncharacterized protein n=1 Tax=Mycena rosella TaxID=1033263 RepID=A0AAD7D6M1_MYCRO|nr:hypothetical protein B0H17DRAFT_1206023 [Mycena rosella]
MALEGEDKALEEKLLQRIEYRRWGLNENLMVPACRGKHSDNDKVEGSQKCEISKAYTAHVAEAFGSGKGSLKAVFQLRQLYMLANERESIAKLNQEKLRWEMANEIAELINAKASEDLANVRKEKSLLEQKVGRLATKLEDAEDLVKRLDSCLDKCKAEIEELYEENRDLEEKLTCKTVMCDASRGNTQQQTEVSMSTAPTLLLAQRMVTLHPGHLEKVDYECEEKLKAPRDCKHQYMMILTPDVQLPSCDTPLAPGILEEVDSRGFPVDAQTCMIRTHALGKDSLATVNLNVVVTVFAHMAMERTDVPPPEWTNTEVNNLRQAADGLPRPPGFNANHTDNLFLRPLVLPWMSSADTAAAFRLANYRHPELTGMCRQLNSVVQARIDSGMWGNPPENKGVIPQLNLFLPGTKERSKVACICSAPVATPGLMPSFTTASNRRKGKGCALAAPSMPGPASHATGIHPALLTVASFA